MAAFKMLDGVVWASVVKIAVYEERYVAAPWWRRPFIRDDWTIAFGTPSQMIDLQNLLNENQHNAEVVFREWCSK